MASLCSAGWSLVVILAAAGPARAWAPTCGNGVVEAGEQCDDGVYNGSANSCCEAACTFAAGESPDLMVSAVPEVTRFGSASGITAYGVGSEVCNLGSCWLRWYRTLPYHPVIAQNMFRLKDGRFEQIGQSWVKHGFGALDGDACGACISPPNYDHLGVLCSDPYSAWNDQHTLGPRVDVDPQTGTFPFPDPRIDTAGPAIFKRLQVHDSDLSPALNGGARYFVEVQYVTSDDPGSAHGDDNIGHREVTVGPFTYDLTLIGDTKRQEPAIHAWKIADPGVLESRVHEGGLFVISARAVPSGPGWWRYEYAVQNVTSQRAARAFTVPIPPGTAIALPGFHDVDYHSGEPIDGTDWPATVTASAVTWSTEAYAVNPSANALRWGTLYNFRFEADLPPGRALATVDLFRPGSPGSFLVQTVAPDASCVGVPEGAACDDGDPCTLGGTCASGACAPAQTVACPGPSVCHDAGMCDASTGLCVIETRPNGEPCDDGIACTENDVCSDGVCAGSGEPAPGEVDASLQLFTDSGAGYTVLYWNDTPRSSTYQVVRGSLADLPVGSGQEEEVCVDAAVPGTATLDAEDPPSGVGFWYLVRGLNGCGPGPYGFRFEHGAPTAPRESTTCP